MPLAARESMNAFVARIERPELVIGFVSPIGADLTGSVGAFRRFLEAQNYKVIEIKVTDVFPVLEKYIAPAQPLVHRPMYPRYTSHIAYGNQLRATFDDNAILAALTVRTIVRKRIRLQKDWAGDRFSATTYLIHQFKRKEEVDLIRSLYGDTFFQVSVYSRRGARLNFLSKLFASSENTANVNEFRPKAEHIIQIDEDEVQEEYGQRVTKIFHDADLVINLDVKDPSPAAQVERFCELMFSSNRFSPTRMEYGMYVAKAAALRTLDLSRQVGAAIFSEDGQIICLGSNEVPKGSGGTYWSDGKFDDRDYVRGYDSNYRRKQEILRELLKIAGRETELDQLLSDPRIRDSQFMDALEYGRIVHAEMTALCDAARSGRPVEGATLYCTTFPCHMCAKHIIASGLSRVVFLEPYPKSLAADLHGGAVEVEHGDRGQYEGFPAVRFEHFFGVTPRRYRELFERVRRKDEDGTFVPYATSTGRPAPFLDIKAPFYTQLEEVVVKQLNNAFLDVTKHEETVLDGSDRE
jgi:deoxycytidylate deaminase